MSTKKYPQGTVVNMEEFILEFLADVKSVAHMQAKVRNMLNNKRARDYVTPGTACDCEGCERDFRGHLQDIVDHDDYAAFLLAGYRQFELGWEPVVIRDFERELVADVESVAAMVEKLRDMLENKDNPQWVEPGIPVRCTCPRDLKAHLQDILDDPEVAESVYRRATGPETEDGLDAFLSMLMSGLEGGGDGPQVRVIRMGPGSEYLQ